MADGDLNVFLLTAAGDSVGEGEKSVAVSRIWLLEGKFGIEVGAPDRRRIG